MEGDLTSDSSSNYSRQQPLVSFGSHGQISILASCYLATPASKTVKGFHYCTPNGAGKCRHLVELSLRSRIFFNWLHVFPYICRSTVVFLRSLRGLKLAWQVLPTTWPASSKRISGRDIKHREITTMPEGRQRKPSQKSVRGSSATRCPWCSLVRGTADTERR